MADQPSNPNVSVNEPSRTGTSPAPAGARKSLVARLATSVATHAYMALAMIVVLVIVVIGMYVYYHGLFFLGPYANANGGGRGGKGGKRAGADTATLGGGDAASDERGDPETERLIDSINHH